MQIVARYYDDGRDELIGVVAVDENGSLYVRGPAARKWQAVHPTLNPTLDAYIDNCVNNFGWRVERVS